MAEDCGLIVALLAAFYHRHRLDFHIRDQGYQAPSLISSTFHITGDIMDSSEIAALETRAWLESVQLKGLGTS